MITGRSRGRSRPLSENQTKGVVNQNNQNNDEVYENCNKYQFEDSANEANKEWNEIINSTAQKM